MNSHDINHGPEIISVRSPPGQRPWMLLGQGRFTHSKCSYKQSQNAPTNNVGYRTTGTQFSQSSLGGRTATKRPKAGRAVNERLGTVSHGNRKDYFRICVLFWPFHLH